MQTIYVKGEAEYTPIPFRELVDLASAAQSHGDLYKDFDNQSKFREWAHSILLEITQGTGMKVKSGSRIYYLTMEMSRGTGECPCIPGTRSE